MGLGDFFKDLGKVGGVAAAPFTGGASLIPSLVGAGASVIGGALDNKSSQTTSPTIDPAYQGLQGQILNMVQQRLATPLDTSGYTANGVASINKNYDLTKQASDNNLTTRGLASSPVAGAVGGVAANARAGDISTFENSVPLLANQIQGQNISQAAGILGLGRGSTSTSASGGGAAGAATNLSQYLGYLTAKGAFKGGSGNSLYPVGGNGTNYAPSPSYGEGY